MTGIRTDLYLKPAARSWRAEPLPPVRAFHESLAGYAVTELVEVPALAAELGAGRVFVKQESQRLGLPAFKVLGASYAIARALTNRLGGTGVMSLPELRAALAGAPPLALIAATDGNHGRAVAHTARLLGLPARIFVPEVISEAGKAGILAEDAEVTVLAAEYDEVVTTAAAAAAEAGEAALHVQDTAWPGYTEIPEWIVEGYATLFEEADAQLAAVGAGAPDVVAVPVGVGSLAQTAVLHYRSGSAAPSVLGVQAHSAPCLVTSLHAGESVSVPTSFTIMAGLNCGTVSGIAWPVLQQGMDAAVAVTDEHAASAVRDLESLGVDSGPCGAASLAGVRALAAAQPLDPDAVVLLISTEGRAANPLS